MNVQMALALRIEANLRAARAELEALPEQELVREGIDDARAVLAAMMDHAECGVLDALLTAVALVAEEPAVDEEEKGLAHLFYRVAALELLEGKGAGVGVVDA